MGVTYIIPVIIAVSKFFSAFHIRAKVPTMSLRFPFQTGRNYSTPTTITQKNLSYATTSALICSSRLL